MIKGSKSISMFAPMNATPIWIKLQKYEMAKRLLSELPSGCRATWHREWKHVPGVSEAIMTLRMDYEEVEELDSA